MNTTANTVVAQANAVEVAVVEKSAPLSGIDARIAKVQSLVRQVFEGRVTNVMEYGVFVAVDPEGKEVGLLHGKAMIGNSRARLANINVGDTLKLTVVSVKLKPNFHNKLLIDLSEIAIPVNKLKALVGTETKVTGTIQGLYDDYLLVNLADGVQARLPVDKLGGTSLDGLKKGVTVKASVASVDGMFVTLTREGIDSVHARAKREAARAENRLLDQQYRSSKKSSGGGKKRK